MTSSHTVLALIVLSACLAAQPRLVVDINRQQGTPASSSPARLTALANGELVFAATTLATGTEPWLVSPTLGLRALGDLVPGPNSSLPMGFTAFLGGALFTAYTPAAGSEPWILPRTGAPRPLLDIQTGVAGSGASDYVVVGASAFFFADNGTLGRELWFTDGTTAGTRLVRDVRPGAASSQPTGLVAFGNGVAFVAEDGQHGFELWVSDGTTAATRMVVDLNLGAAWGAAGTVLPTVVGTHVYFHGNDGQSGAELWRSDGTAVGTTLVTDLIPGPVGSAPSDLTAFGGGRVMFVATAPQVGRELCITDGTSAGTVVLDLAPGASSMPSSLSADGTGRVFFAASSPATGNELGVSDGTAAGTHLLDVTPGPSGTGAIAVRAIAGVAFVVSTIGEVLRSTGSLSGTQVLAPADATRSRRPALVALAPNLAYFPGGSPVGEELWVTDGTPAGTRLAYDIDPFHPTGDSFPELVGQLAGRALLLASSNGARQLHISDGTAAGTNGIVAAEPTGFAPQAIDMGDSVLLPLLIGGGPRLLRTDGTPQGTRALAVPIRAEMDGVALDASRAVFAGADSNGTEPFITDGTDAGTRLIADLNGAVSSSPAQFTRIGRTVYFSAADSVLGNEVWRTDGTAAGTALVRDVQPSPRFVVTLLGAAGGYLIFGADDGVVGYELWRTDGTAAGTQRLIDLNPGTPSSTFYRSSAVELDGRLVFAALTRNGQQVFATDGQNVVALPIQPLIASAAPFSLARAGQRVIAMSNPLRADRTIELFHTNGTAAGTAPLSAPFPAGLPSALAPAGLRTVAFSVSPTGALVQLYRVDDGAPPRVTAMGTIATDGTFGEPVPMLVGGQFFVPAWDSQHGIELWSVPAGAIAETHGLGCGSRDVGLTATPPRLNSLLTLTIDGQAASAFMLLGAPAPTPVRFSTGVATCTAYLGQPLVTLQLPSGAMSLAVPIPGAVNLLGSTIAAQAVVGPTATGIDISNGVRLQLGY